MVGPRLTHPHAELGPRPPNSSDVLPRLLHRALTTSENPGFLLSLAGTYVSLLQSQAPLHSRIPAPLPPWMSLRGEETQEKYSEAEETSPAPWGQTWATAVHPSWGGSSCDFEIPRREIRGWERDSGLDMFAHQSSVQQIFTKCLTHVRCSEYTWFGACFLVYTPEFN